jgi:hypothetical protein
MDNKVGVRKIPKRIKGMKGGKHIPTQRRRKRMFSIENTWFDPTPHNQVSREMILAQTPAKLSLIETSIVG